MPPHTSAKLLIVIGIGTFVLAVAAVLLVAEVATPPGESVLGADIAGIGRTVGLICAAAAAVPGVILAYRRQRALDNSNNLMAEADFNDADKNYNDRRDSIERDRRSRFTSIAEQLAAPASIVRMAAVSAMEALADEWLGDIHVDEAQRRREAQTCVNVLCSYLRAPYADPNGSDHAGTLTRKVNKDSEQKGRESEEHREYPIHDLEVRQTIARIIAAHLRPKDPPVVPTVRRYPGPWSNMELDLTGAYFCNAVFLDCVFSARVSFASAHFAGIHAIFEGAAFLGPDTSFEQAEFASASETCFTSAEFRGTNASFTHAKFKSESTRFDKAYFGGKFIFFVDAEFSGGASFAKAKFAGGQTRFSGAKFTGDHIVTFEYAEFTGVGARFDSATFASLSTLFVGAEFTGGHVWFVDSKFTGVQTWFDGAQFVGEYAEFDEARFTGKNVSFNGTLFTGNHVSFGGVMFSCDKVSFGMRRHPRLRNVEPRPANLSGIEGLTVEMFSVATIVTGDQATVWPEGFSPHYIPGWLPANG